MNEISDISALQRCTQLKELYVRKNQIADLQQFMYLAQLPILDTLLSMDNPAVDNPEYRMYLIRALPKLIKLDEVDITKEERQ